jgi:SAM-dependent methyltransferase
VTAASEQSARRANARRFEGLGDVYDRYRPAVPAVVPEILTQIARAPRPRLVVDIGCGTGLSMLPWLGRAEQVVGVEPCDEMLQATRRRFVGASAVRCVAGTGEQTPLPDACAEIVTASQSLHWMHPARVFREAARLLVPGGVFAAIDYRCLPTFDWEAEALYLSFLRRARARVVAEGREPGVEKWRKDGHLMRMQTSGQFRYVRAISLHSVESGDAERLVGFALSHGSVQALLASGLTAEEIGLEAFRAEAQRLLAGPSRKWYLSYELGVGVK